MASSEERREPERATARDAEAGVRGGRGDRRRSRVWTLGRDPRPAASDVLPTRDAPLPALAPGVPLLLRARAPRPGSGGGVGMVGLDVRFVPSPGNPGGVCGSAGERTDQSALLDDGAS